MSGPIRALIASEFWSGSTARGLVPGFRSLGWAIEEIDERRFFPGLPDLVARAEARLVRKIRLTAFNRAILEAADRIRPAALLTVKGTFIAPGTLDSLHRRGIVCVNYYPDFHFNDIGIDRIAQYDLIATTKSFQVEPLSKLMPPATVSLVHHGFSDEVHRAFPSREADRDVDILYVGNASPGKAALMARVVEAFPDANIRVYGHRWAEVARGTPLAQAIAGFAVAGDFYAAEIARAKIVLAFHMEPDSRTGDFDRVSTRTFEIPACGGFMLHVDNDEVRSLFDVPSEMDTFGTPEEMIDKVRYWLAHPEERQAVALRGHARAVPAYGYRARAGEIAALVKQHLSRTP